MNNPSAAEIKSSARLLHLDGLRGLAALFVVIAHFFNLFDYALIDGLPKDSLVGIEPWIARSPLNIIFGGGVMVQIFFVLSGYVLVRSFMENSSFLGALSRRYIRLALPIFVGCLAAWLLNILGLNFAPKILALRHSPWLTGIYDTGLPRQDIGEVLSQAFYRVLFTVTNTWKMDGPLWTMAIEFSSSVLLIIFCRLLKSKKVDAYAILFVFTLFTWGYYQFYILCGSWLFLFEKKGYLFEIIPWKVFIPLCLLAVLYASQPIAKAVFVYNIFSFQESHFIEYGSPNIFCFEACDRTALFHGFGALLILFLVNGSPLLKIFLSRFVFLGKISFPLYLIHQPLLFATAGISLYVFNITNSWLISMLVLAPIYFCIVFYSSWLIYLHVEKPAVAFSKRVGFSMDRFCEKPEPL
ncbi:MAG: acyltransferase [Methylacidiphilales bacterium]|nr:acyltransferase [Candidatus Methylacidiphilales bacterium]